MSDTAGDHGIPLVDVGPALDGGAPGLRAVATELDRVYSTLGFGLIVNHGIEPGLIDDLFAASRRFHALPRETKLAIEVNEHHRGFIKMASSTLVTSTVEQVRTPNQSESFMVMHELAPDHPDVVAGLPLAGPNQWPAGVDGLREPIGRYVEAMRGLGLQLTRAIAVALGAAADTFLPAFADPVTFLRLLWYPPQPADSPEDLMGAAPHTDYGFITLLAQDEHPGLQVRSPAGEWLDVPVVPGAFVMNSADILRRWSNGRWLSTPHRVVNRSGAERYSAPFFYDPHLSTVVEPLPSCVPPGTAPRFEPVHYGEYLMERLRKNYRRHQDHAPRPTPAATPKEQSW